MNSKREILSALFRGEISRSEALQAIAQLKYRGGIASRVLERGETLSDNDTIVVTCADGTEEAMIYGRYRQLLVTLPPIVFCDFSGPDLPDQAPPDDPDPDPIPAAPGPPARRVVTDNSAPTPKELEMQARARRRMLRNQGWTLTPDKDEE